MEKKKKSRSSGSRKLSKWSDALDHLDPEWSEGRTYQLVCGLTVPKNLRILGVGENSAKSNRFLPWRVPAGWPPPEEDGDWAWFLHPETHEWVFTQWLGSLWWKLTRTTCGEHHAGKNCRGKKKNRGPEVPSNFVAFHERRRQDPELDAQFRAQCVENGRKTSHTKNLGKRHSPEVNASKGRKGEANAVFGMKRITDGERNLWHDPSQPLPEGFIFGLTRRRRARPSTGPSEEGS